MEFRIEIRNLFIQCWFFSYLYFFVDRLIFFAKLFIAKVEVVCFLKPANFYPLKCIIIADCKSIIQKRNIYANFSVSYFLSCASYKAGSQDPVAWR